MRQVLLVLPVDESALLHFAQRPTQLQHDAPISPRAGGQIESFMAQLR